MNLRIQLLTCAAAAALFTLTPSAEAQSRVAGGGSAQTLSALGYVDGGAGQSKKAEKAKKAKSSKADDGRSKQKPAKQVNLYEMKELIAGLEAGRASLDKLGEAKQAKQMAKLIAKLEAKFEALRADAERGRSLGMDVGGQRGELDMSHLGLRMRAVAVARDFHKQAGWGTATRQLDALLECGRLIEAGADGDEIMEAYAGAPNVDERIEMLDRSARGLKQAGKSDRAMLCAALSKWYAGKRDTVLAPGTKEVPMRPQAGDAPEAPRQPRRLSLEERADRIEILGIARDAHLAGGSRQAADRIGALMNLGMLQEAGASSEELARATPQDVTMEQLVGYVRQAAPVLEQNGKPAKAKACRALADFYAKRDGLAAGGSTDRAPDEARRPSTGTFRFSQQPPAPRRPQAADGMEARLDALQRQIEELRRAVAEMRGGQRRR